MRYLYCGYDSLTLLHIERDTRKDIGARANTDAPSFYGLRLRQIGT